MYYSRPDGVSRSQTYVTGGIIIIYLIVGINLQFSTTVGKITLYHYMRTKLTNKHKWIANGHFSLGTGTCAVPHANYDTHDWYLGTAPVFFLIVAQGL